ncbi:MAG TPA: glycosyltransferase family 4 protein [Candidatus Dormibacteraeota bacterium]|nr:glycosyltransferase family 4 protein [Candidatus Dormibacteraeota bacterium]
MDIKSLKIGFVLDDSLDKPDGGVQQYILALGDQLEKLGHEVHYLVGETNNTKLNNIHSLSRNIRVRFNKNRMSIPLPASRQTIENLLSDQSFDVLHIQLPYSPWLGGRVIKAAQEQTIVFGTFHIVGHSFTVNLASKLLAVWTKASLSRFDQIVAVSTAAKEFAKHNFGIQSTVLPNAINYQRFHDAKPFSGYNDDLPTVLFLGRLVPRKGCLTLLRAVNLIVSVYPDLKFRVLVCGSGPLLPKLKQYVELNNLQSTIEFCGFVSEEDKPSYYASADISVFPSTGGESFGIVLLEAMSSGRAAVLAGDNEGYRSVLKDQPGLLFPPSRADILADKIKKFLVNEPERQTMARWGEAYSVQFSATKVAQDLVDFYQKALLIRRKVR